MIFCRHTYIPTISMTKCNFYGTDIFFGVNIFNNTFININPRQPLNLLNFATVRQMLSLFDKYVI